MNARADRVGDDAAVGRQHPRDRGRHGAEPDGVRRSAASYHSTSKALPCCTSTTARVGESATARTIPFGLNEVTARRAFVS